MEDWKSKTLTESQFQLIDENFKNRINQLEAENENEQIDILKKLRYFYILRLRNFQFLLNKAAFEVFNITYKIAHTKVSYILDPSVEEQKWYWGMSNSQKLEKLKADLPNFDSSIQNVITNILDNELTPLTNDMRAILQDYLDPYEAEDLLDHVLYLSF